MLKLTQRENQRILCLNTTFKRVLRETKCENKNIEELKKMTERIDEILDKIERE